MKKIIIILILMLSSMLTGCFNYRDLNRVVFSTSVVVDVNDDGSPILYIEAFKPLRGSGKDSGKGERLLFMAKGKTILEAIRDADLSTSYKLNFTQNKAVIFTKKSAEYGIDNFIDIFDRAQEFLSRQYVFVYFGETEKLLKAKLKDEEYIGLHLADLIQNQGTSSRTVEINIHDYYNQRLIGDDVSLVTVIDIKKGQPEEKLEVNGAVVVKNDKMVSYLQKQDGQKYNFLMNNIVSGTLEPENPEDKNKFVTLEILRSKTRTKLTYKNNRILLKKEIDIKTTFAETQKSIKFNQSELNKIKASAEFNVKSLCTQLFDEYKKNGLDIFQIQEEFERQYPKEKKIDDIIKKTDIQIEVNLQIEGTLNTMDF